MLRGRNLLLGLLVVAVAIQFVPVERTNPPVHDEAFRAPPEVMEVVERACFDCHSNRTRWPWYARVAPVSWLVVSDVEEGREHLNLSTWGRLSPEKQRELRHEMAEEVAEGAMPLPIYTWMHRDAIDPGERQRLVDWGGGPGGSAEHGTEGDGH